MKFPVSVHFNRNKRHMYLSICCLECFSCTTVGHFGYLAEVCLVLLTISPFLRSKFFRVEGLLAI